MSIYEVKKVNEPLNISGKGDSILWKKANELTDFKSPWDAKNIEPITFRALCNSEHLYFCFRVEDVDVYIDKTDDTKASINNSDRVELFFRQDEKLNPYYCLEIDPSPRIMDFIARPQRQFDFNWNWPQGDIDVKSAFDANGFTVEGAVSIKSLNDFGLLRGNTIETGIYRAKYHLQANGSYEPAWITWVDPNTEEPDFHIVSSFGRLILES